MYSVEKKNFMDSICDKSADELLVIISDLYDEKTDISIKYKELRNADNELAIQFQQMKDECAAVKRENIELHKQNLHLTGIKESQAKNLFGRSSEDMDDILENMENVIFDNPLDEDSKTDHESDNSEKNSSHNDDQSRKDEKHGKGKSKGNKTSGKKEKDLSELPAQIIFELNTQALNDKYGEGNWCISFWEKHDTVEIVRTYTYLKRLYSPVVSVGEYRDLYREPYEGSLLPKSIVSSSLMSDIFFNKYNLFQPLYRIENNDIYGLSLSRQRMSYWVIKISQDLLFPVWLKMKDMLMNCKYQQCDETTYTVINDGRKAGSKCYVWTHRTSELMNCHQIILYCIEKTRGAKHLYDFYNELLETIYLICDAYSAYDSLEKEIPDKMNICGCFMHVRRRFFYAAVIQKLTSLSVGLDENEVPEYKAISLIEKIYAEEDKLRNLSAEERLEKRQVYVKPCMDQFFEYIHELNNNGISSFSDKMKDAISYTLNQEEKLRKALEDGNIPIDNGATERSIKPIALGRKNYLFSTSMKGAEATVIVSSLIETAKQNGADPYYYLKYVMEQMSLKVYYYHNDINMDDLYPWSEKYILYEKEQKQERLHNTAPPGNEKPVSPKIRSKRSSVA